MYLPYACYTSHRSYFLLMFANQLWADHFGTWLIAKLFYSVYKMLWTCGADFKYYEVAYLRLRTSRITKLRTCSCGFNNPEISLRTCGCGLRKLKFYYGFADYGLKKKLAVPRTGYWKNCNLFGFIGTSKIHKKKYLPWFSDINFFIVFIRLFLWLYAQSNWPVWDF